MSEADLCFSARQRHSPRIHTNSTLDEAVHYQASPKVIKAANYQLSFDKHLWQAQILLLRQKSL